MTVSMLIAGILTIASACGVIFARRPLNSALCLVATLFLVAVNFVLLDAGFLAVLQVLVYAGAIMVLVIFVIMLLGVDTEMFEMGLKTPRLSIQIIFGAVTVGGFLGLLFVAIAYVTEANLFGPLPSVASDFGSTEMVGKLLFTKFVYAFEVVSLLLLAAIIGAVLIAQDKIRPLNRDRGLKAKHLD